MPLRKKAACRKYSITRNVLDVAIAKGEITLSDQGWIDEAQLIEWLASKRRGPRVTAALKKHAGREPAGRQSGEPVIGEAFADETHIAAAAAADEPMQAPPEQPSRGGALINKELLDLFEGVHISHSTIQQAESVHAFNKASTGIIALEEKQLKFMQESGRLADVRELEHMVDKLLQTLTSRITSLDVQLASEIARKHKIPAKQVKQVLAAAGAYMIRLMQDEGQAFSDRAEQFVIDKNADIRRRNRR